MVTLHLKLYHLGQVIVYHLGGSGRVCRNLGNSHGFQVKGRGDKSLLQSIEMVLQKIDCQQGRGVEGGGGVTRRRESGNFGCDTTKIPNHLLPPGNNQSFR